MTLSTDPIDLLLDTDTHDLVIDTDLHFTTGVVAVAQDAWIALSMFAGEWFMDLTLGYPYWQSILGQPADIAVSAARSVTRSLLLKVENVVNVSSLTVSYVPLTRGLEVQWVLQAQFDDTPADTIATIAAGNPTGINVIGISGGPA